VKIDLGIRLAQRREGVSSIDKSLISSINAKVIEIAVGIHEFRVSIMKLSLRGDA